MDKSTIFMTYLVLTFAIAISLTVIIYEELKSTYLEHDIMMNISLSLGIMVGVLVSFVIYTLKNNCTKRKLPTTL